MKSILMSDFVLLNYDVGGDGGNYDMVSLTRTPRKSSSTHREHHALPWVGTAFRVIAGRQLAWPSLT